MASYLYEKVKEMSVTHIEDPNEININTGLVNSIAQYQDMNIYAELSAKSRGRTVIVTTNIGENQTQTDKGGESICFLGFNQNADNPNNLAFTTNYYDGSTNNNEKQFESFGISSIKVLVNSSYVPQISIQFVDIRGLSFFNEKDSPYRILFNFPPPIFNLKIKGYYGKTLEYQLHLVKYTTEFKADNGNFIIDADFVAITFAPLSDVLFRYIINFPLMTQNSSSMNPEQIVAPRNTNELVLKLKNLYSATNDKLKNSTESVEYDNIINKINANNDAILALSSFAAKLSNINSIGTPYVFINDTTSSSYSTLETETLMSNYYTQKFFGNDATSLNTSSSIIPLPDNNLLEYNNTIMNIESNNIPVNFSKRLCIGYIVSNNRDLIFNTLNSFRNEMLNETSKVGSNNTIINTDIKSPSSVNSYYDIVSNTFYYENNRVIEYLYIDVTDFYFKLYRAKTNLEEAKKNLSGKINTIINNSIIQNLGMKPTIYNIFKIILDDVDFFFRTLSEYSEKAENHHNKATNKAIIAGSVTDASTDNYIYSFPLIIDKFNEGCVLKEVRVSPKTINNKLPLSEPFPELELVKNFIDTFTTQKQMSKIFTMKSEKNDDGNNIWIPITPQDSSLSGQNVASPYPNLDPNGNGVNIDENNFINQILLVALNRYYAVSQYSFPYDFYNVKNKAYINMFSKSEALNVILSLTSSKLKNKLYEFSKTYENRLNGIGGFYDYLKKNLNEVYEFPDNTVTNIDGYVLDKNDVNYKGVQIYTGTVEQQDVSSEGNSPLSIFKKSVQKTFWEEIFKGGKLPASTYTFTKENVLYIRDVKINGDNVVDEKRSYVYNNDYFRTRCLNNVNFYETSIYRINNPLATIDEFYNNGNKHFKTIGLLPSSQDTKLNTFNSVVDKWINVLSAQDDNMKTDIIDSNSDLSTIILISSFGNALSTFNIFPYKLNEMIFKMPAAIEVPAYLPLYIGSLVYAIRNNMISDLKNFFTIGGGRYLDNLGFFIFADLHDIDTYLSDNDKDMFYNYFDSKISEGNNGLIDNLHRGIKDLYETVKSDISSINDSGDRAKAKRNAYESYLNPNSNNSKNTTYYSLTIQPLIQKTTLLVYNQNAFNISDINSPSTYKSLNSIVSGNDNNVKNGNDTYFRQFFGYLKSELLKNNADNKEIEEEQKRLSGDDDIITETYYSFKTINDKWLCDMIKTNGYPFNYKISETGNNYSDLIDSFAFVDRAMNPIGDTVINPEILLDLYNDTNVSVFSVLSQLLSMNGFEFFPLQNFMSYSDDEWLNVMFKLDPGGAVTRRPAFVCMYIGGTSNYLSNNVNGFKNDGIENIGASGLQDFESSCIPTDNPDDKQFENNPNFPWKQVRSFSVKFGQQNQSMFTDIKIDSKEFPETNESIQLLSRLAGDEGKNAPIPKGQNLYNVYENRAYRATITGLGNAMIQPTQYFQLDNIPMYNGAYVILSVEHVIVPNKMTTTFSGTKILKYPIPRVTNPAAVMGFEGGSAESTISSNTPGEIIQKFSPDNINNNMAKYDSMYTTLIQ